MPPQTAKPPPRRRRWRYAVLLVLLAVLLAGIGGLGWQHYTGQRALRQLREAGLDVTWPQGSLGERLSKAARHQPLQLFSARTWDAASVVLSFDVTKAGQLRNLDAVAPALRRVNPTSIKIYGCHSLQNLDGLKGLTALRELLLDECRALVNVDGLQGCIALESLRLTDGTVLQDVNGLKRLPRLTMLWLQNFAALKNIDGLQGLASLRQADLTDCAALQDVNGLKGLTGLHHLDLARCSALENVDGLKGLAALKLLHLDGCPKITPEQVAALKATLPGTVITDP